MFTRRLSQFIAGTHYEDLSVTTVTAAKKAILDSIGVTMAGSQEPSGKIINEYVRENKSMPESTVIGGRFKAECSLAALANGTSGHVLDYDDCLDYPHAMLFHPTTAILPAALAIAEKYAMTGKELITAYCLGLEVYAKSGLLAYKGSQGSKSLGGWELTGVLGSVGANAAVAKLLKLDEQKTNMSFGIAVSLASGLTQNFGTMAGHLHAGNAARNGIVACSLAKKGFTSFEGIFEAPGGFSNVLTGRRDRVAQAEMEEVLATLGNPWVLLTPGLMFKSFPCAHISHFGADAGVQLKQKYSIDWHQIAEIEFNVNSRLKGAGYQVPRNGIEGRFSPAHCLCRALIDGKVQLAHFTDEKVKEPSIVQLMNEIKWIVREDAPGGSSVFDYQEVTLKMKDRSVYTCRVDHPRGEPLNPQTAEEFNAKFQDCSSWAHYDNAAEIEDLILDMENIKDITQLTALLGK
jgi:2-methylcitrate dehydratase PrpD